MYKKLRQEIENTPRSKRWHKEILERSEGKCEHCGETKNFHVHHLDSFYSIIKDCRITTTLQAVECKPLWDLENGIVLCEDCHKETPSYKYWVSKKEEEEKTRTRKEVELRPVEAERRTRKIEVKEDNKTINTTEYLKKNEPEDIPF